MWTDIETTIFHADATNGPTPVQTVSEAWLSLIHEANGIIYFIDSWNPSFREDAIFNTPAMVTAVTALNAQIKALAPELNSATLPGMVSVSSATPAATVDSMVKVHGSTLYIFSAVSKPGSTMASFTVHGMTGNAVATVVGENRTVTITGGSFSDMFAANAVHIYSFDLSIVWVPPAERPIRPVHPRERSGAAPPQARRVAHLDALKPVATVVNAPLAPFTPRTGLGRTSPVPAVRPTELPLAHIVIGRRAIRGVDPLGRFPPRSERAAMKIHAPVFSLILLLGSSVALAQTPPPPSAPDAPPTPAPSAVVTEPPPSTGTGLIVTGSVFTGIGALNLLTSPICKVESFFPAARTQNLCLGLSLGIGGTLFAVGLPTVIVGAKRRAEFREWTQRHGFVGFVLTQGGGALAWHGAF